MSLQEQLADDLELKLKEDMQRVMQHYVEMCEIADLDKGTQWATLVSTMASGAMTLAILRKMPKEVFLNALDKTWDSVVRRRKQGDEQ